jgi:multiple sugar transport system permease protein
MTTALAPGRAVPVSALLRAKRRRHRLTVLAFLAPWLIGLAIFFIYPLIMTVYYSFTRFDLVTPAKWIGFRNYEFFWSKDPKVWQSIRNTLWLVAILVPARMLFGLGVSMILTTVRRGGGLFRTLFYLPALAPPAAATLAFVFMFNPETGPVNVGLKALGINGPLWFNDPNWAKPALVLLGLWGIGDLMIIFLASLLDVPKDQYEAASLDGANSWQRFRFVTFPNITPVLTFAAVTGVIAALQYFTEAAVAAQVASGKANVGEGISSQLGYPDNSTLTYPIWLYSKGFGDYSLGYASALAVILFAVSVIFTVFLLRRAHAFTPSEESLK